jgi:hypothetical protein
LCFFALFSEVLYFIVMFRHFWIICGFISSTISSYAAIDIIFDYSYDSANWFGAEQRYILEQAAYAFESRLGSENFQSAIPTDPVYSSSGTHYLWFTNPVNGSNDKFQLGQLTGDGYTMGATNKVTIFMGTGAASGNTNAWASGNFATADSSNKDNSNHSDAFQNYLDNTRDSGGDGASPINYDPIGGAISVNSARAWYFDTDLTDYDDTLNKMDFYSTMVHEIGHLMGFRNSSDAWTTHLQGSSWNGPKAKAQYSGNPIPLSSGLSHFDSSFDLTQATCLCHPNMDPYSSNNQRSPFSDTDWAVLEDIGYTVTLTPVDLTGNAFSINNTFTQRGTAPLPIWQDYTTWFNSDPVNASLSPGGFQTTGSGSAAPEPAYIFTILGGFVALLGGRKHLNKFKSFFKIV